MAPDWGSPQGVRGGPSLLGFPQVIAWLRPPKPSFVGRMPGVGLGIPKGESQGPSKGST